MGTNRTNKRKKRSMKKQGKYRAGRRFFTNVLVLITLALVFFAAVKIYREQIDHNFFYQGVYIDDLAMGGLTKEEALKLLSSTGTDKLNQVNIRLVYQEHEWVLNKEAIGLTTNIPQLVEEGYSLGRSGNWLDRIKAVYTLRSNPIYMYSEASYHTKELDAYLTEIGETLNIQAVDAAITFHPDKDVKFIITDEKPGRVLDTDAVYNEIKAGLEQGSIDFSVKLKFIEVEPKVFAADFAGKTEKLITFGTDLSKSAADRTHNVVKAAAQFNGLVVAPGEIVSFNEVVGERTAEKGYRAAPMIVADKSLRDAIGGGVSQTSSTFYNAAIRSGLDVIEYQRHSFPVAYIGKGLDTTVNLPMPVIDIKVKNTKDSPIYIRTFYANQKVYFEIYGEPLPNGRTIRIRTEEYETVAAPPPEIRKDETGQYVTYEDQKYIHVAPRQGYKVRVYRDIMEGDRVVESELLDDHYYRPIAGITYVGVQKRPEEVPETSPEPETEMDFPDNDD
jgi:vancomycin resistance protein YoaR